MELTIALILSLVALELFFFCIITLKDAQARKRNFEVFESESRFNKRKVHRFNFSLYEVSKQEAMNLEEETKIVFWNDISADYTIKKINADVVNQICKAKSHIKFFVFTNPDKVEV